MLHADASSRGQEFDWVDAGDPSADLVAEFDRLSELDITEFIQ